MTIQEKRRRAKEFLQRCERYDGGEEQQITVSDVPVRQQQPQSGFRTEPPRICIIGGNRSNNNDTARMLAAVMVLQILTLAVLIIKR